MSCGAFDDAVLAVLRAGGAVQLGDPRQPRSRRRMFQRSRARRDDARIRADATS